MVTPRGAVDRHRAWLSLPKDSPREVLRTTWSIAWSQPGFHSRTPPTPTTTHLPTSIEREWRKPDPTNPDADPSDLWVYRRRGACLGCDWEGPDRRRYNEPIEDALDHTFPGWCELPILPAVRRRGWDQHRLAVYPERWFDVSGPLRVWATPPDYRHKPGGAPGGGYLVVVRAPKVTVSTQQLALL